MSDANRATYQYDAYGNTTARTGSLTNSFRYAGGYQDADKLPPSLTSRRATTTPYSTEQFLSVDPLLAVTGQAYNYVGGGPVNLLHFFPWEPGEEPTGCAFKLGARVSHTSAAGVGINGSPMLCRGVWPPRSPRIWPSSFHRGVLSGHHQLCSLGLSTGSAQC